MTSSSTSDADAGVVIVGAGVAGNSCAEALRARGHEGPIHLVGAEPHLPYDRTTLSKDVLGGRRAPEDVHYHDEAWYADRDVTLHLGVRVTAIDPAARTVTTSAGDTLPWSRLLLATGGRPRPLPAPGADAEGVFTLRDLDDVVRIQAAAGSGARAAVIGGGFIGAEVAASLRQTGHEVTLVERMPHPMEAVVGAEVAEIIARIHREEGVEVVAPCAEVSLRGAGRVEAMVADGEERPVDLVVVGLGIAPSTELGAAAGCEVRSGIVVDDRCRTSVEGIYAAGDVAEFPSRFAVGGDGLMRMEHYANAVDQGAAAASSMLGDEQPYDHVPWFWSDQYDVNLRYVGYAPSWDEIVWRGDRASREFSAFYLREGRLLAACVSGRARDFRGAREILAGGVPVTAAQLADADVDLHAHARGR